MIHRPASQYFTTTCCTPQEELKKSNFEYLGEHPELKNIIADFTAAGREAIDTRTLTTKRYSRHS